jgi:hypothetical protein
MSKRLALVVVAATVICLALVSVALAATPQDIYDDWADNGQFDGTYTCEELNTALGDATINQYGDQDIIDALEDLINEQCRDEYPFTGFQLTIAGIVAVVLIAGGFALRRYARTQKS